jgi:hypothetical protein
VVNKVSDHLFSFYVQTAAVYTVKYSIEELALIKEFADNPGKVESYLEGCKGENSTRLQNAFLAYYWKSKREVPEKTFGACLDELLDFFAGQPLETMDSMKSPLTERMLARFNRGADGWSPDFANKVGAAAKGVLEKFYHASRDEAFNIKKFIQDFNKDQDVHVRAVANVMKSGSGSFFRSPESSEKFKEKLNALYVATQIKCERLNEVVTSKL